MESHHNNNCLLEFINSFCLIILSFRKINAQFRLLILIIILASLFSEKIYSQKFQLTNINSTKFSIDRIAQKVYFKDFFTDTVRVINLKTLEIRKTDFQILPPILSNKLHLMVYRYSIIDINRKKSYDINTSNTDSLGDLPNSDFAGSFSPNDVNFMYGNPKYYIPLTDSVFKPIETGLCVYGIVDYFTTDAWPQWSSDSSFIFLSVEKTIAEYFLKSKRIATLVTGNTRITGFDYNIKHKILAYSKYENYPGIYFHYQDKQIDSLVFGTLGDDSISLCWREPVTLEALSWSPDEIKLAFLYRHLTNPITGIYVYNIDSSKIYHGTNCSDGDVKYHLTWANNDTLIYDDESEKMLYGIDVSNIYTSIKEKYKNQIPNGFTLTNYPNPFNPSTTIQYEIPASLNPSKGGTLVQLKVYDVLGREVKTLVNQYHNKGSHEIIFDAGNLSSGVYFYQLRAGHFISTKKMLLLR